MPKAGASRPALRRRRRSPFAAAKAWKRCPSPKPRGDADRLQSFLNIEADDWPLVAAWTLAALYPHGPYPILILMAEQGGAKSTTARVLKEIVDPSTAKLRGQPDDVRDLMVAAHNSRVLAFDNLSAMHSDISDALCRIATGGGYAKRSLYTDMDEMVIHVQRPVILNGIGNVANRADLLDRAIAIHLPALPDVRRHDEADFWREFNAAKPSILGGFLDVLSWTLAALPHTSLEQLPRMADFAKLAVAAEPALAVEPGSFLRRYADNRYVGADALLENLPVVAALKKLVAVHGSWTGATSELLDALECHASERERAARQWPKTAQKLTNDLKRLAPTLRQAGIVHAEYKRTHTGRTWSLTRLENCLS